MLLWCMIFYHLSYTYCNSIAVQSDTAVFKSAASLLIDQEITRSLSHKLIYLNIYLSKYIDFICTVSINTQRDGLS